MKLEKEDAHSETKHFQEKYERLFNSVSGLNQRIEELEDLLIEMKQKSGVAKIVDQESQINALNLDVGVKEKVIRDLNNKFDELSKKETQYLD